MSCDPLYQVMESKGRMSLRRSSASVASMAVTVVGTSKQSKTIEFVIILVSLNELKKNYKEIRDLIGDFEKKIDLSFYSSAEDICDIPN